MIEIIKIKRLSNIIVVLLSLCFSFSSLANSKAEIALGKQIYQQGIGIDGQPLTAIVQNDVVVSGQQFRCQACHRRSGYGSSEGGIFVLPVTANNLFNARTSDRVKMFKEMYLEIQPNKFWSAIRTPTPRPAYTKESLGKLLSEGIDPANRQMQAVMPKYKIGEQDLKALYAYLKTLSSEPDPGVGVKDIHFATVITEDMKEPKVQAMLAVMKAFFEWQTLETKRWKEQPKDRFQFYKSQFVHSYKEWKLSVWELTGPKETWERQLAAYYTKQPVFAVVGGYAPKEWRPVHKFCEQQELPCIFPNTQMPDLNNKNLYNVYFHGGLKAQAELVHEFIKTKPLSNQQSTVQISLNDDEYSQVPAQIILKNNKQVKHYIAKTAEEFKQYAREQEGVNNLILWPGDMATELIQWLENEWLDVDRIFYPTQPLDEWQLSGAGENRDHLFFPYLYAVSGDYQPRAFRIRGWMNTRKIEISHKRLQFNTYYALSLIQHSLRHMIDDFSRDYMVEIIEHEAENALNTGTFPQLSLGPNQRLASKGGYIIQINDKSKVEAVSDWIVP